MQIHTDISLCIWQIIYSNSQIWDDHVIVTWLSVLFVCRLEDFVQWMDKIEGQVKELEQQSLTPEQYKDTISRFKVSLVGGYMNQN